MSHTNPVSKLIRISLATLLLASPGSSLAEDTEILAPPVSSPLAVGAGHACVVTEQQKVQCWGANAEGQIGDGSRAPREVPVSVFALEHVTAVAVGDAHSCAIIGDGAVKCWGRNSSGQLGAGLLFAAANAIVVPIRVEGLTDATALALGADHTCALTRTGDVFCWGLNDKGQLGDGTTQIRHAPTRVSKISDVVRIAAGTAHSCALTQDGSVHCWGLNAKGQLGDSKQENRVEPFRVGGLDRAVAIAAGGEHSCALDETKRLFCWGNNIHGQLGNGFVLEAQLVPNRVIGLGEVEAIALGHNHSCALRPESGVRCWGDNSAGQLGDGKTEGYYIPVEAYAPRQSWWVAAGGNRSCTVSGLGSLSCWGSGQASPASVRIASRVSYEGRFDGVSLTGITFQGGRGFTCAILEDSKVYCWGLNSYGATGIGSTSGTTPPSTPVPGVNSAIQIAAGGSHACALESGGSVKCWGRGPEGQIGNGAYANSPTAQKVLEDAVSITAGEAFTCAVLRSGETKCWGQNDKGQLGDGTTTSRAAPSTTVELPSPPVQIAATYKHACAVLADGEVHCWGSNQYGELGDTTATQRSAPAKVQGLSDVIQVGTAPHHTCALKRDGTVWCWGYNGNGELGTGDATNRATPAQVPGLPVVTRIEVQHHFTCVLTEDRAVWCWGYNAYGHVGNGTTSAAYSPVKVLTGAVDIALGRFSAFAIFEDGSVKGWGANESGQLANGSTSNASAPTVTTLPARPAQRGAAIRRRGSPGVTAGSVGSGPAGGHAGGSGASEPANPTQPGASGREDAERYDDRF